MYNLYGWLGADPDDDLDSKLEKLALFESAAKTEDLIVIESTKYLLANKSYESEYKKHHLQYVAFALVLARGAELEDRNLWRKRLVEFGPETHIHLIDSQV